jgi:hypothetical protein
MSSRMIAALKVRTQGARVPLRELERRSLGPLQAAAAEVGLVFRL